MSNQTEENDNHSQKLTLKKPLSLEKKYKIDQQIRQIAADQNPTAQSREETLPKWTKEQQQKHRENLQQALNWLISAFPHCFNYQNPTPLKKRIEYDIYPHLPQDGSIRKPTIGFAISYYTKNFAYLYSVLNSQKRIDLQGNPVEEITDSEKEYTQKILAWLKSQRVGKFKKPTDSAGKAEDKDAA